MPMARLRHTLFPLRGGKSKNLKDFAGLNPVARTSQK
jgi:hypothetical protein